MELKKDVAVTGGKTEETKYQHYHSSRVAMNMMTHTGGKIKFVGGKYITADPTHIKYLDKEIELGLRDITKGELLTHKESDPMELLRAKHIAEYLEAEQEEIKQKALGITKDMGDTESKPAISPASSKDVAK